MSAPETTLRITYFSDRQRVMMSLLEKQESVIVCGAYVGDALSLQAQGAITSQVIETAGEKKLEIRKVKRP